MKKFGFGCMRLPMIESEVDYEQFKNMIDEYLKEGFTYFDTARVYIKGKSEIALRECLVKRYPRDSFILADKLSSFCFEKKEELSGFFTSQLEALGTDYIDYYLIHAVSRNNYQKYLDVDGFNFCKKLKEEGKIKHLGLSFHDSAKMLDDILNAHPEIEFVQLQFNYLDYDSVNVESKKCYDVARKHNKDIMIMEPVKGGELVNLPKEAEEILTKFNNGSNASYAIRFAASYEGVVMVLSGMSTLEQMRDNLSYMKDFKPFTKEEYDAVFEIASLIKQKKLIPCTGCRYCVEGCVKKIDIPAMFANLNKKILNSDFDETLYSQIILNKGRASDCVKCGKCENECPQHLPIRELLVKVTKEFE